MNIAGLFSVFMGVVGIFVPLLPTTPFLLLAAYLFAKSSPKLYNKLLSNKYLGEYITNYREKKGIKRSHKIFVISLLWISFSYSAFFAVEALWLRILLLSIASAITIHLIKMKTYKGEKNNDKN